MREVYTRRELDEIKDAEHGYILNERPGVKRLHRVTCNDVAIMWINPHPKFFFSGFEEARKWADERYGQYPGTAGRIAVTAMRLKISGKTQTEPWPTAQPSSRDSLLPGAPHRAEFEPSMILGGTISRQLCLMGSRSG
jgi:hypothetical protein